MASNLPAPLNFFGDTAHSAYLNAVNAFRPSFAKIVALVSYETKWTKETRTVDGKRFTLSIVDYPKSKPAEVAARYLLALQRHPRQTIGHTVAVFTEEQRKKIFGRDFEPISMTVIAGVLIALLPVIIPKIIDLVTTWIEEDEKTAQAKFADAKAVADAAAEVEKNKIDPLVIGGIVVGVLAVGLIAFNLTKGR